MPRSRANHSLLESIQDLELLAKGGAPAESKYAPVRGTRAQKKHRVEDEFEHAVCVALEAVGFRTRRLGQRMPGQRKPDAIAAPPVSPKYSLVVDAKVTQVRYSLPARDQRALVEYAKRYSRQLKGMGCEKFHLLVISSDFGTGLRPGIESIKQDTRDTILDRVYFVPARVLREVVHLKLGDARLGETFIEELFTAGPDVFDLGHVRKAKKKISETF
jgi:hypothetical protein